MCVRVAVPFIGLQRIGSNGNYSTFFNAPIFPKKDLYLHRSYTVRKSFKGRKCGSFVVRFGWYYISHWDYPQSAISLWEIIGALKHLHRVHELNRELDNKQ